MKTLLLALLATASAEAPTTEAGMLLDDFSRDDNLSAIDTRWSATSDRVMGGVSDVHAVRADDERPHIHMTGEVKAVPGYGTPGFVQVALDLGMLDASDYSGLRLTVRGDGGTYGAHLRTPEVTRPWQSWRGTFTAPEDWTTVELPFTDFIPHRIEGDLDQSRLYRLSLIAVDRLGNADLQIAEVSLYR